MSEPVIPERYKDDYETAWHHEKRTLIRELGTAEAKVAEQAATIEFAKTKYSAYRDEATAEYARYELMLAEQASTIERLTRGDESCWRMWRIVMARRFINAALSKQEPK